MTPREIGLRIGTVSGALVLLWVGLVCVDGIAATDAALIAVECAAVYAIGILMIASVLAAFALGIGLAVALIEGAWTGSER